MLLQLGFQTVRRVVRLRAIVRVALICHLLRHLAEQHAFDAETACPFAVADCGGVVIRRYGIGRARLPAFAELPCGVCRIVKPHRTDANPALDKALAGRRGFKAGRANPWLVFLGMKPGPRWQ